MKYFIPAGKPMTVFHRTADGKEALSLGPPNYSEKDVTYNDADVMKPSSLASKRFRLPRSPQHHYFAVEFATWDVQEIPE